MLRKLTIAAIAVTGLAAAAAAQGPGWRALGNKRVSGADTDTIALLGRARYNQLRLCAYRAPLHMTDFDVFYRNGTRDDLNTRARIAPGTCTRAIDLRGRNRDIQLVRFRYEQIRRDRVRPEVRLFGR